MPEFEAEVLCTDKVDRQHLLHNIWNWHQIQGKARYVTSLDSAVPWKGTCIGEQPWGLALYPSSLSSVRAIMSATSGKLFVPWNRLQNQTLEVVNPSHCHCHDCDEHLGDARKACVHCIVDSPVLWLEIDNILEEVRCQGGVLLTKVESMMGVELLTTNMSVDCDDLLKV